VLPERIGDLKQQQVGSLACDIEISQANGYLAFGFRQEPPQDDAGIENDGGHRSRSWRTSVALSVNERPAKLARIWSARSQDVARAVTKAFGVGAGRHRPSRGGRRARCDRAPGTGGWRSALQ